MPETNIQGAVRDLADVLRPALEEANRAVLDFQRAWAEGLAQRERDAFWNHPAARK